MLAFCITSMFAYDLPNVQHPQKLRDPFHLPSKNHSIKQNVAIILEGIVYSGSQRSAAVLSYGQEREVVRRGERFGGYKLSCIGKNFVILSRGNQRRKIILD